MTGEPGSAAPSNVTVCSTGSRLVQRTACPGEVVTASPANFMAALQAARGVGLTTEPTSALSPTYGFRRALTPPANAAAPSPDCPRRRDTARAAPCTVSGPCVQATPTSPSTLFARRL